jgi:hypothetical protein
MLRVGHRDAAEAQHQIVEPRLADRVAVGGRKRLADIDAGDVGGEPRRERADGDGHVSALRSI